MADDPITDDRAGMLRTVAQVLGRLSPEFLGLLIVDALFMASVIYLLHAQNASRERVLGPALNACLESVPMDAVKLMVRPESGGSCQESVSNMRDKLTDLSNSVRDLRHDIDALRPAIEALRPAMDTMRAELTRDTRARLQGPVR